jgi:DNA polymerase-3 subunit delta
MTLVELRTDVDSGLGIDETIEKHRIFFRERAGTQRALRRWTAAQLARAIERARETERALMSAGSVGEVLAAAECVAIARAAARSR